ncbi:MAG: hypothetical protein JSU95_02875 [Betaproteobacteria bacterium]|nr:MAG: hypothetical protein JSU95_02875 [Betaproteobacteria bacterium]
MRRILFNLLVAGALLSGLSAMADNPRHNVVFISENGRYVLLNVHLAIERVPIFENGRYVGVMRSKRQEPDWGLFDAQAAKALDPSNDLETLMAGSAPFYMLRGDFASKTALVSDDGTSIVVIDDFSEALPDTDLEVLHFYDAGRLVATYRLGELLGSVENVQYTSSHFLWFLSDSLSFDGETLLLTTTECVPLEFAASRGVMSIAPPSTTIEAAHSQGDCPALPR